MSDLVVFDFDGIHTADEVLNKLRSLQKEYLIDLEDRLCGRARRGWQGSHQASCESHGVCRGDGRAERRGVGNFGRSPLLESACAMAIGGVTGAGIGALSGSLTDYGIRDDFIKKLGETIPEGSSALFILFKKVREDKVQKELEPYKPRILRTSLSSEDEKRISAELSKAA